MWKQLAAADPPLKYDEDIDLFALFSTVELAKKRVKFPKFVPNPAMQAQPITKIRASD
jgi:hypothetical protein